MSDMSDLDGINSLIQTPGLDVPTSGANGSDPSINDFLEAAFSENGGPGYSAPLVNSLTGVRIIGSGHQQIPIPDDTIGLVFTTRPNLNLSDANIKNHTQLLPLYQPKPHSLQAYIKGLLDPTWGKANSGMIEFLDPLNPWLVPITNLVKTSEGFPDISLRVDKSKPGFRQEVYQYISGLLKYNRDLDIRQTYWTPKPNFMPYIFETWEHYIEGVSLGDEGMQPYPEALLQSYQDYDCRIYHMILNKNMRNIEWIFCNASCFPTTFPSGAMSAIDRTQDSIRGQGQDELAINFSGVGFRFGNMKVADMFNRSTVYMNPDMGANRTSKYRKLSFSEYYRGGYKKGVYPWINVNTMELEFWRTLND